jgi:cytochrome c peroxidase
MRTAGGGALVAGIVAQGGRVPAEAAPGPRGVKDDASAAALEAAKCGRVFPGRGAKPLGNPQQGSSVALTEWQKARVALVAHEDDRALYAVDIGQGKRVGATMLDGMPSSVLPLPDGRVAVALRDKHRVEIFEPSAASSEPLTRRCTLSVAEEPVALALSPKGETLVVTSGWGRKLAAFDVATMRTRLEVDLPREPRAVVIDDDGQRAFVTHVVEAKMSVVDLPMGASSATASVRTIDLAVTRGVGGEKQQGCQGFALAKAVTPDPKPGERPAVKGTAPPPPPNQGAGQKPKKGDVLPAAPAKPGEPQIAVEGRIFAPMVTVDIGDRAVSSGGYGSPERGPAERPVVSVIDEGAERALTRSASADRNLSIDACLLPRAAAFVPTSQSLLVTCLGSDVVVELDARALDPSRRERARFRVPAGPTGIAVDDASREAVVFSQFGSKLSVIPLASGAGKANVRVIDVPRSSRGPAAEILRGREVFHATNDRRISGDGRACASCHPDGREDALTWSTPAGPRQTIMLAGRLSDSAPFGWSGGNKTLESHVVETFSRLGGTGFHDAGDRADLRALISYIGAMQAPPGRAPSAASAALIARGKELFDDEEQACASCHAAGGTDRRAYEVAVPDRSGLETPIDTPSLRGIAGTAPYFHDGRFSTLDDLLASPDHSMGRTLHLTRKDRVALAAFLETL